MVLSGGVDPVTGRNMTAREIRQHIADLAEAGLALYAGGALLEGAAPAAQAFQQPIAAPKVPNPYGKLGGPAHQAKVEQVIADIKARGLHPEREFRVETINGQKEVRFMDVVAIDPQTNRVVEVHQIGRTLKSDPLVPVARERAALRDVRYSPEIRGAKRIFHSVDE
jgi:hypothetical protein